MWLTFDAYIANAVVPTRASAVSVGTMGVDAGAWVGCRACGSLVNWAIRQSTTIIFYYITIYAKTLVAMTDELLTTYFEPNARSSDDKRRWHNVVLMLSPTFIKWVVGAYIPNAEISKWEMLPCDTLKAEFCSTKMWNSIICKFPIIAWKKQHRWAIMWWTCIVTTRTMYTRATQ